MIKLTDILLNEEVTNQYPQYMYSSVGFGCHVCKFLNYNKDEGAYTCGNKNYQEYMKTHLLIDPTTKEPVTKENLNNLKKNIKNILF